MARLLLRCQRSPSDIGTSPSHRLTISGDGRPRNRPAMTCRIDAPLPSCHSSVAATRRTEWTLERTLLNAEFCVLGRNITRNQAVWWRVACELVHYYMRIGELVIDRSSTSFPNSVRWSGNRRGGDRRVSNSCVPTSIWYFDFTRRLFGIRKPNERRSVRTSALMYRETNLTKTAIR